MTKHHKHNEAMNEEKQDTVETAEEIVEEAEAAEEQVEQPAENDAKIAEMQEEINKLKDLYLRSQAEMENLRRRTQQELEKRSKFAISTFAQDLLPVGDNLSRALGSIPADDRENELFKNLIIGLELTQKDLNNALEKNKITAIESVGQVFNPNWHKVVQEVDDPTKPAGTIIQEWQKGYMIGGDRVLREAVVVVTRGGPQPGAKPAEHVDTMA